MTFPCPPSSISAALFLVPIHLKFLRRVVRNINESHCPFEELVVVASGFTPHHRRISRELRLVAGPTRVKVLWRDLLPLGSNRNAAIDAASNDLVVFLDPDDLYSPRRNCSVSKVFLDRKVDVFCHSYFTDPHARNPDFSFPEEETLEISRSYSSSSFINRTLIDPPRQRDEELAGSRPPQLRLDDPTHQFPIHHGHMSFRKSSLRGIRFDENLRRGTDVVFLADLLEAGSNFLVSRARLSLYLPNNSSLITPRLRLGRWFRRNRTIMKIRSITRLRR